MNGCMETAKPQISILMAIYEPRMDWLREQLLSLDAQTYPNIKLYIRDDCSPTVSFDAIQSCVQDCIRTFPYEIWRNEENLGSNRTFERLTREADGEYFAYCDQDDIWLQKLEILENELVRKGATLICSDVRVIDGDGNQTADSITKVRHRHLFLSGAGVFRSLLTRNFVIGCTMLMRRESAQKAVPFVDEMVHDHWLALSAAAEGNVISVLQPLIHYRIHGGNQTGVLVGVSSKKDYKEKRIMLFEKRIRSIARRIPDNEEVERVLQWAEARRKFASGSLGAAFRMWKFRSENFATTIFELVALPLPELLFRYALRFAKRTG